MQLRNENEIGIFEIFFKFFILGFVATFLTYSDASALTLTDFYIQPGETDLITGDCIYPDPAYNSIIIYDQNAPGAPVNATDCNYQVPGQAYNAGNYFFIDTYTPDSLVNDCEFLSLSDCLRIHPLAGAQAENVGAGVWKSAPGALLGSFQGSEMLASVSTGVQDTGLTLWVIVALAIAIPLTFWAFEKVIGIFRAIQDQNKADSEAVARTIRESDRLVEESKKLLKNKR